MRIPTSLAAGLCASVLSATSPAIAATIPVPPDGNLQQAIDSARPGDTIELRAGATYTGNFSLPNKSGDGLVTIRTAGDAGLPGEGARVSPAHLPALATIRSGSNAPTFQTRAGAHHWRLMLLEIQGNANGSGDIVTLGDGSGAQTSLAQIAHDLVLDRVYMHGDPTKGHKRGIALNSASTTITGSYVADIKAVGQDSQAILGWNGPGPYTITNNYLEAAGENLMFGGADPSVPNLIPSDITITDNQFAKQPGWRDENWVVKNLIELKNARRVTIARNTFDYNWQGGQSGYAIVFTVRNQDGNCPWCQVANITFEQNVVRHSAAGIQILGYDNNHPSLQTQAIVIRDNVFADIDSSNWGGNGYFLALTGGARDITIDHNTIAQGIASGIVTLDGPPVLGFVFTNNLVKHSSYGFIGTNHGVGNDSISAFLPGSEVTRNVMAGGVAGKYPAGNSFPSPAQFEAQFIAYAAGDYRLAGASPWRGAGTDGADLGARFDAGAGPAPPREPPREPPPIEGEGIVTAAIPASSCPSLQFMIGEYRVSVGASTQFSGGGCGSIGVGATLGVKGYLTEGRAVFASALTIVGAGAPRPAAGRGIVTAILPAAGCPALQFMIGVYNVSVDGTTQFAAGKCRDIAVGTTMDVRGSLVTDTRVIASQIGIVR
jgi:Right handed beta helix region/Domain of unknown function (DUF5666)